MSSTLLRLARPLLVIVFLGASWTQSSAANLPAVRNVSISGDQLTWGPVEGATGYNVYQEGRYLTTVRGDRMLTLSEVGSYRVVAFDDDGNFSPSVFSASDTPFFADGVDNRPQTFLVEDGSLYVTRRCFDVNAGESCTASCPDFVGGFFIGSTTGGACSSSDDSGMNASVGPKEYSCTVPNFTARVEAQAVCRTTPNTQ